MKNRKKLITLFFSICLVLLVLGISYAFFIYNKTGLYTHTITGGKMKVIYDELAGNNITIENAYPLTDEEALTKSLEFEFTITGYNESDKNIYYAIEMDHGSDITGKTRFLDRDMKLTLYENEKMVYENEIFDNLDNQGIHYGYIKSGTDSTNPTINNYKMNIWINDNVYISDTIEDNISLWDDNDLYWADNYLDYDEIEQIDNGAVKTLNELGISVYTSDEFANRYAGFKVNVRANLTGQDIGMLFYDANGGEYTPKATSLTTNMVTTQKPVMANKGFLGWSSDEDATEPEYYAGDYYSGPAQMLYAVYDDEINMMTNFQTEFVFNSNLESMDEKYFDLDMVSQVIFIREDLDKIRERYEEAPVKADITYQNNGLVYCWVELEEYDYDYITTLYVASPGVIYLTDCVELFSDFTNCYYIDLRNADTSKIKDMSYMFSYAGGNLNASPLSSNGVDYEVKQISYNMNKPGMIIDNIESLNTFNVTSMSHMFSRSSVYEIDLSNFNTPNLEDMSYMFEECHNIVEIDLSKLDTSNVINMQGLFFDVWNVENIDLTNFDTSNVIDMSYMFNHFGGNFDIRGFDTSNVIDMSYMFYMCQSFSNFKLSDFDTSSVTDMSNMFSEIWSNEKCDLNFFDTGNVENMENMFLGSKFSEIICNSWDTSNVSNTQSMFYRCSNLINLNISDWNTSRLNDMSHMFYGCSNLINLNLGDWDTSGLNDMSYTFYGCSSLNYLNLSDWDVGMVSDMSYAFRGCSNLRDLNINGWREVGAITFEKCFSECNSLESLDLSDWSTPNATNLAYMFDYCSGLIELNLSGLDTSNVTDMTFIFRSCSGLGEIDVSNFDTSNVITMFGMFAECSSLEFLDLDNFITTSLTDMAAMVRNCSQLKTIKLNNFDTSKVTTFASLFYCCKSLTTIEGLEKFNSSNVTTMTNMFAGCESIREIDLSHFHTSKVTDLSTMFAGCLKVVSIDLSNFDTSNVTTMKDMFAFTYKFSMLYALEALDISSFTFTSNLTSYSGIFSGLTYYAIPYVKSQTEKDWILNLKYSNYNPDRPGWGDSNIIIKNS